MIGILILSLLGYQPILGFPPIQKKVGTVLAADFSTNTQINSLHAPISFDLPHPGYISTHFSAWHPGIDIAMGLGTPVHPVAEGTVSEVTYGFFGLGHMVVVTHPDGYKSTYGHLGRIFIKAGDSVSKNSILGEIGLTGHTSGPHTHLEVTRDDRYIDPETLLPHLKDYPEAQYINPASPQPPIGGEQAPLSTSLDQIKPEIRLDLKKELQVSL